LAVITTCRLVGDVEFGGASSTAAAITPVPGGVGPMTITMLLSNTLKSAQRAMGQQVAGGSGGAAAAAAPRAGVTSAAAAG
jgi:hypothetical protein